jgi:molecular chaperone Hsp33
MDCDETLKLRGMVSVADSAALASASFGELVGKGALTLTLDTGGEPYQSHVELTGDTLAQAFEHYLGVSEQTPTRLYLFADATRAAGLFLQALPGAAAKDADGWNRVQALADTVKAEELLGLGAIALLSRLFAEEDVRVYDPRPVNYGCVRDPAKIYAMLRQIGQAECEAVLAEQGEIRVHDDMCDYIYVLDAAEVAGLFAA